MGEINTALDTGKRLLIPGDLNKNNFDFLRFCLAVAVIYSHCFVIFHGVMNDTEPVSIFTHNQVDLGTIAVCFFFVISGFLIVKSFEHSSNKFEYLIKRILRICPGFFAAFLISVFVLGTLGAINSSDNKLQQWKFYLQSLPGKRIVWQLFTLEAPKDAKTFLTNPLPKMINESLWTIQYEFACYLLVPLLSVTEVIKRKWLAVAFFLTSYVLLVLQTIHFITITDNERNWIFLYPSELPLLLSCFFAGSCIYFFRQYIKRNTLLILFAIILILLASWRGNGINLLLPIAGTYILFSFVYHPRVKFYDFAKRGDFSYGLYLYGWAVQQLIMYFFAKHPGANYLFFIAFPISFLMAYFSWHIIENPFLKVKRLLKSSY
jgi:peptidoglycan/LPS O-acetylase OafA/YrhL